MVAHSRLPWSGTTSSVCNFIRRNPLKLACRFWGISVSSSLTVDSVVITLGLTKRIIACLDVHDGRVVKGVNFVNLRDAGDPAELAHAHSRNGADEIVLLDITATSDNRGTLVDVVRRTARELFIPFTVGGGIRTLADAAAIF